MEVKIAHGGGYTLLRTNLEVSVEIDVKLIEVLEDKR